MPGELRTPGQIEILSGHEIVGEPTKFLEGAPANGQVATARGREKVKQGHGGWGSVRKRRGDRLLIKRPIVEDSGGDVGISQGGDVSTQPPLLHDIVSVTEGQQVTLGLHDTSVSCSSWAAGIRRVDDSHRREAVDPFPCNRAAPIGRVIVGNDDLPRFVALLFDKGAQLRLQPRHAIAYRDDDTDHG